MSCQFRNNWVAALQPAEPNFLVLPKTHPLFPLDLAVVNCSKVLNGSFAYVVIRVYLICSKSDLCSLVSCQYTSRAPPHNSHSTTLSTVFISHTNPLYNWLISGSTTKFRDLLYIKSSVCHLWRQRNAKIASSKKNLSPKLPSRLIFLLLFLLFLSSPFLFCLIISLSLKHQAMREKLIHSPCKSTIYAHVEGSRNLST